MSETIKNIKNFNIGDRVTSTHSILLDRGFRGVTGVIKTIVLDGRTWQYLIELDDGRELQCDDWHLEQPQLNDNQKIVLEWLKVYLVDDCDFYNTLKQMYSLQINGIAYKKENLAFMKLTERELAQVVQVFSNWFLEQEEENNDH